MVSVAEQRINDVSSILLILKALNELVEITPELQEGENRQVINDFRVRMMDKLLRKLPEIN